MSEEQTGKLQVTLAIPCYNGSLTLALAIQSALEQIRLPDEILVIDDGSQDHTLSVAQSYPVRVISHPERKGIAAARNTALRSAKGEIIVFIDADTSAHPNLVQTLLSGYIDSKVGGVGGQGIEDNLINYCDKWRKYFWPQTHGSEPLDESWMLMGLCCSYRRIALDSVGGFDERYKTNAEDVDIGIRLRLHGYRLAYMPDAIVYHRRSDNLRSLISMVARHSYWQNRAVLGRRRTAPPVFYKALQWLIIATGSSIKTHQSITLTALSLLLCSIGISARLLAYLDIRE